MNIKNWNTIIKNLNIKVNKLKIKNKKYINVQDKICKKYLKTKYEKL